MDSAVNAATAEQGLIGGIDDDINVERGDVGFDDIDAVPHGPIGDADQRHDQVPAAGASTCVRDLLAEA
jgi:hypothetical protein